MRGKLTGRTAGELVILVVCVLILLATLLIATALIGMAVGLIGQVVQPD
jgi:hypothetical protein